MTAQNQSARIVIIDDHPMIREGLAIRLSTESGLTICGDAATEDEAVELVRATTPDLAIVDLSLKSGNGLDVIKRIHAIDPTLKILVLTGWQESLYAERALRAGALGYLNKQESSEKVFEAIRALLAGQRYVSAEIAQRLMGKALGSGDAATSGIEQLTNRELEVFRMIGEGMTTGAIANKLFLSTHTIDTHRENIKRKLNAKNAAELTRAAVEWILGNRTEE